jgi:hypothetical protein
MSSVDGKVTGLNADVYKTLQNIRSRNAGPLTKEDAQELKAAIEKDGVDENEQDLLNEFLAGNNDVHVYAKDAEPNSEGIKFQGVGTEAQETLGELAHVERLTNPEHSEETGEHHPDVGDLNSLHEEHDEHKFAERAEEMLHAKFGIKNATAGAIAKELFVAYHDPDPVKKAKAIALIIVRLNETPEGKKAIQRIAAPLVAALPEKSPLRNIMTKLFTEKDKSDSRISFLATVLDGKFDGLKDIRATYELLDAFGPDIKALMPESIKEHVEKLETLFGNELAKHTKEVIQKLLPLGENSDFVKATMKMITGDGVNKLGAGVDFLNAVGKRIVGADNKTLAAINSFLKIDTRTGNALRHLLDPHAPVQLRAEALEHLGHTFHHRLEEIMKHFKIEHGEDVLKHAEAHPSPETGKTGDAHPTEEPHATGDTPKVDGETPKVDGETPKVDGETPKVDGETPKVDGETPKVEGETPRIETDTPSTSGAGDVVSAETKAAEAAAAKEAKLTATAEKLGLDVEGKAALTKILSNEHLDEEAFQKSLQMLEKMGAEEAQTAVKIMQHMEPDIARRIFTNGELGSKVLSGMIKMLPALEKVGMTMAEILPKLAKGIGKVLPVAGAVVSGYDAVRLGAIAGTGKDLNGKEYKDPDVRALALLGAGANGLDTALAVLEATGVGNIDLPVQLGLAGVEVGIDLMVEYYNDHPEKMPPELRLGIKAAALGVAVGAPFVLPGAGLAATAAVVNIYGLDGTIDIATELTKVMGNGALDGINKLHELQAKALDRGLEGMTDGINGLADVVRNPEKYAAQLGKSVEEVLSQATDMLMKKAGEGLDAAKQVYDVLKDVATNPGVYGQKAVDFALDTGMKIGKGIASATVAAGTFVKDMTTKGLIAVGDGMKALYEMGAQGARAAKDLMNSALRKGGDMAQSAIDFAKDVVNNPGKYGEMAGQMAAQAAVALRDAVKAGYAKAGDALVALKDMAAHGIQSAVQGITDVVAAGGAMAVKALEFLKDAPGNVADAIGAGLKAAYRTGAKGLEVAKWVAQNPQLALQKLGAAGQQALEATRDYLVDTAKNIKGKAGEAMQYLEGLYNRTGAALGRFGDAVVDVMKHGVDVGKEIVGRYWDVIKKRGPELMSALGNLGTAGIDLMAKVGKWHTDAAQWAVDGMVNAVSSAGSAVKSYALQKLNEMGATDAIVKLVNQGKATVNDIKRMGSQAIDAIKKYGNPEALGKLLQSGVVKAGDMINSLMSQGADGIRKLVETSKHYSGLAKEFMGKVMKEMSSAWDQSSITNGYKPLRDLIGKYMSEAAQAGGEAAAWVKKQLGDALATLDKNMEDAQKGNWVVVSIPDSIVNLVR